MALLVDNDVVDKLAELDLLQEAGEILRSRFGSLVILDTLKYKLCPKKLSKRKKRNATVMSRIEMFIKEDIIEISPEVKAEFLLHAIESTGGLDVGEMQLLQVLLDKESDMLFTGDKRFLKALVSVDSLNEHLEQVSERFICFEQIICFLIMELGFEFIKDKFLQALDAGIQVDRALKICFEGQRNAVEERVTEALNSYITSLRKESGQLLSADHVF